MNVKRLPKDFPVELRELRAWLVDEGFNVVATRKSRDFGSWATELSREDISVRLTLDRGLWGVELGAPEAGMWLGVPTLKMYIFGEAPERYSSMALEEQCSVVREHLGEFCGAIGDPGLPGWIQEWSLRLFS